ncbi:protein of unknown function [Pararobbsia alpina]
MPTGRRRCATGSSGNEANWRWLAKRGNVRADDRLVTVKDGAAHAASHEETWRFAL